ncbi:DNA metabolism protein [Parasphingopyxis algicola]|uniref:TIGR03915 family putative DNA repair protein n=1 Tax=Parasphingopyxis algicola TaxID=2026624 RepID=UPI00159FB108|nr:TIGR03915 family putative DNA repair protein [Parasphingopyxis algicola]QLC24606.1 DNA metabolism protein [Parasphingopyxis algicola]
MPLVPLASPTDWEGWRSAARALCAEGVPPEAVDWRCGEAQRGLFAGEEEWRSAAPPPVAVRAPRRFLTLSRYVICHRDEERFARLYRLLVRLQGEPALLANAADPDVAWTLKRAKAIRRDRHKMHAFVRFRKLGERDGRERFAAWFEPDHRIVELATPFFVRRFPNMDWAILTPERSAVWQDGALRYGPGASRQDVPDADMVEAEWKAYFAAIFNPARLKVKAMTAEMPKKYWRNLPEAELIPGLIAGAGDRNKAMLETVVTAPSALSKRIVRRR